MTRPTKSVRRRRAGAAVQVILVRFVLALALKYLLTPLIDLLSYSVPLLPSECCGGCRLKLPRALAILVALALAVSCLGVLGVVVGRSIGEFATHADSYRARLEELLGRALNATSSLHSLALGDDGGWAAHGQKGTLLKVDGDAHWRTALMELAKRLNLTEMFMRCLGTAAQVTENSIYIVLFLAFMLAGDAGDDGAHARGAGVRGGLLWSGGGPGSRAAPRSRGEPWPGAKIRARAQDQGS
mmetsp:Transcript_42077/g.116268  ORF Transcript_42077/g.116268 Transcript_42077/m.116268 type:complete len:242 (+) Transcript_42077:366-1091(+)